MRDGVANEEPRVKNARANQTVLKIPGKHCKK